MLRALTFIIICLSAYDSLAQDYFSEKIFASVNDYSVSDAKEKAFKDALDKALIDVAEKYNIDVQRYKSDVIDSMTSFDIHGEVISQNKYSAEFVFQFDGSYLDSISKLNHLGSEEDSNPRVVYEFSKKCTQLLDLPYQAANLYGYSLHMSKEIETINQEDLFIRCDCRDNGAFLLSARSEENSISITGNNMVYGYLSILNALEYIMTEDKMPKQNLIIIEHVADLTSNEREAMSFLKKYISPESIEVIGFSESRDPVYLLRVPKNDDLLLTYVYHNNNYNLSDMRVFERILEVDHDHANK